MQEIIIFEMFIYDFYEFYYKKCFCFWQLFLIEINKVGYFFMEFCEVECFCFYLFKFDGDMIIKMLWFVVQVFKECKMQIEKMVVQFQWGNDRFFK